MTTEAQYALFYDLQIAKLEAEKREIEAKYTWRETLSTKNELVYEKAQGVVNGFIQAIEIVEKAINIDLEEVSNCCGAPMYEDSDICMDCKEHCGTTRI